jgi:hypothetical protein
MHLKEELEERGNEEAVQDAEEAIRLQERALTFEYDYDAQKNQDPMVHEGAQELDNRIDKTLSQLLQAAEAFAGLEAETRQQQLAEELIDELMPTGVYPITSKSFGEQHLAVDEMLGRLHSDFSEHVQVLSLDEIVDQLAELNEEFGEKVNRPGDTVTYDEVQAARAEAQDAFDRLLIKILHDYGDDLETLREILEPVHRQERQMKRSLRRTGEAQEVDPETGEPVEPNEQDPSETSPDDGPADGGAPEGEGDSPDDGTSDGDGETSDGSGDGTSETDETSDNSGDGTN